VIDSLARARQRVAKIVAALPWRTAQDVRQKKEVVATNFDLGESQFTCLRSCLRDCDLAIGHASLREDRIPEAEPSVGSEPFWWGLIESWCIATPGPTLPMMLAGWRLATVCSSKGRWRHRLHGHPGQA
jgi:hypothetical protein